MTTLTGLEVLALPMDDNDADADTVREYLVNLLDALWSEGESFSGKRPFGNSGWENELLNAVESAGVTDAKEQAEAIFRAIGALNPPL